MARTYVDFLKETADLERLPLIPEPGEVEFKFDSTYDRTGGNMDGGDWTDMPHDDQKVQLVDLKGPGCVHRIYSAFPSGQMKFYFDGEETSRIDVSALDLFLNRAYPFLHPLAGLVGGGWYCYLPITYAKSLRIVCYKREKPVWYERDRGQYWQITSKRYPNQEIETFPREFGAEQKEALARLNARWSKLDGEDPKPAQADPRVAHRAVRLAAGQTLAFAPLAGPGVVDALRVRMLPQDERALRSTVLRIWWDGEETPSVQSPVGDFFGNGWGGRTYRAMFLGMGELGYYCYLPMPFGLSARIEIKNEDAERAVDLDAEVAYHPVDRLAPNAGRLHAEWHCEQTVAVVHPKPKDPKAWNYEKNLTGEENYVFAEAKGRGKYIGTTLNMDNFGTFWWGEGDPMHFVDDDTWPPTYHGTGSEEYFNDAWGFREGNMAISGSIRGGYEGQNTNWYGKNAIFTFHLADGLPFQKRLRATIEHGHANDQGNWYSSCAFWYQIEPHAAFKALPAVKDRLQRLRRRNGPGRTDAAGLMQSLRGKAKTGAKIVKIEDVSPEMCMSNVLSIPDLGPRASYTFPVACETAGECLIGGYFAPGPDQGCWQLSVDGKAVGKCLDLYAPESAAGSFVEIGRKRLAKGVRKIALSACGRSPLSAGQGLRIEFLTVCPLKEKPVDAYSIVGSFAPSAREEAQKVWETYRTLLDPVFRPLYESYPIGKGQTASWANKPADPKTHVLDCAKLFGRADGTAIAQGKILAMDPIETTLSVAHAGYLEVWLNGKPVYRDPGKAGLTQAEIAVRLEPAFNIVSVLSRGNGKQWKFRVATMGQVFATGAWGAVMM